MMKQTFLKKILARFNITFGSEFQFIYVPPLYPYAVMFTDGTSSWYPQSNKKIWGVVPFYGTAIRLDEAEKTMNWDEAQEYCNDIKIAGYSCSCGSRHGWNSVLYFNSQILDQFLVSLGGNPLKHYLWTSDYFFSGRAFFTMYEQSRELLVADDTHLFHVRPMCIYA